MANLLVVEKQERTPFAQRRLISVDPVTRVDWLHSSQHARTYQRKPSDPIAWGAIQQQCGRDWLHP